MGQSLPQCGTGGIPQGTYTIYYHSSCTKFWGRALPIAMSFEQVGVLYECKEIDDAPDGTGFVAAPAIKSPSGACIAQLPAICILLGEELQLVPRNPAQKAKHAQHVLDADDLLQEVFKDKDEDRFRKWFDYLSKSITRSGGPFLLGLTPTPADYFMLFSFLWVDKKNKKFYTGSPPINSWLAAVKATQGYQKIEKTGIALIP
eukprot:gnl/TRDRNA2_/TRDRNA2_104123_c0_seq1.p1 gnl/TRDRNA2_/TRDRNA2_104123_c0~~gnl/TRDRNA2_/TRDRNA2_104123_c0_seq1.p1  ORF type:complete len:203 (+),score=38.05 gnl/TRDRNA2_/TRDRNA2_104123_c0_seq1:57-665(+)